MIYENLVYTPSFIKAGSVIQQFIGGRETQTHRLHKPTLGFLGKGSSLKTVNEYIKKVIYLGWGVESNWVHSALRPLIGLLCQPRVMMMMMQKLVE
jgi:hypothetical protein